MELIDFQDYMKTPRDVVIFSHRNPDGDAIGSSLAMFQILVQMGHTVDIVFPSECPVNFKWMPDIHRVNVYDIHTEACNTLISKAEVHFYLDFNSLDRIDKIGEFIHSKNAFLSIVIDHHIDPEPIADIAFIDWTSSSTCELVFDFLHTLQWTKYINETVAQSLVTGILTDTGSFKYNTRPILFNKIANLLNFGVDLNAVQNHTFNNISEKQLRLLGHCLSNRMEVIYDYKTALISLSKEDYKLFDIQRGDTEGIVNYLLQIEGISLAIFIMEQPTITKLSFRSIGDLNVQEFARDYFKGGGHKNASGGFIYASLAKTVEYLKSKLPDFTTNSMLIQ